MSKRTVNVAVIGAGAIGLDHIGNFQKHPQIRVVAVAETNEQRGREACERFQIPEAVKDYRKLLKRSDIAACSVALPNYLHGKVGLDVLTAGKHLMMEKPFTTCAREAEALVAAARTRKLVLMVGQNQRFTPQAQTLKQIVQRGDLGRVYHAEAFWLRRAGIPRIGSWFTQKKLAGGGCTYDIGVHMLDLALHLMGDFDAASVSGQTFRNFGHRGLGNGGWGRSEVDPRMPFDVDDFAVAMIKLRSGRTVILRTSWAAHLPLGIENSVQLLGTEAAVSVSPFQLCRSDALGNAVVDLATLPPLVNPNRMAHFADVVLHKAKPFVPMMESLQVQRILDGIYESARTGKEVRIRG